MLIRKTWTYGEVFEGPCVLDVRERSLEIFKLLINLIRSLLGFGNL